ncbi:2-keto-4-pentenoate hydratase [Methylobacterium oryzihabitans]|uniref:Hydratase n=1 Tax=Methylobacterium oryzihabitans TaxID=2499852 RepID=A0A3S2VB22_9HYPH|nr:hydratase [Methylobacterium oryzihabitans]RVU20191.1 hydratase [Methylobacterium oryzihabitans]
MHRLAAFLGLAVVVATPAEAACPADDAVAATQTAFAEGNPAKSFGPGLTVADGLCAQDKLVARLRPQLGRVVGYKAAATSKRIQEVLKLDGPARGTLLERMLLPDGSEVAASPAFMSEADMLLVVKDEGVNDATEPAEIVRHLSAAVPFIELPGATSQLAKGEVLDGPNLIALNAFARQGVTGTPIPLTGSAADVEALGTMQITFVDDTGKEHARSPGSAVLGHPLAVVAWLARDLKASGIRLKAGDVISLGSFSPFVPPQAGRTMTARYEGLPGGDGQVSVRFR